MSALADAIRAELAAPVPAGAHALTARLRAMYGPSLRAVLMYGSCLRQGDDRGGVVDLYALVDGYRPAYRSSVLAALNRLLPPNVFYLEVEMDRRTVRCKYAVLALDDLVRLTSASTFEPYFWARFAQPCALAYAADDAAREAVVTALAGAVTTFVTLVAPLAGPGADARTLWTTGWRTTYRAEVRPERPGATEALYASAAARYERITALVLPTLPAGAFERSTTLWPLRRLHAKTRFLLRILRNALIFEGGVEYVLWKIQRHSGIAIDPEWRQKRHRWLALGAEAWRLYRARAFR
jgi:hypothetical protein